MPPPRDDLFPGADRYPPPDAASDARFDDEPADDLGRLTAEEWAEDKRREGERHGDHDDRDSV